MNFLPALVSTHHWRAVPHCIFMYDSLFLLLYHIRRAAFHFLVDFGNVKARHAEHDELEPAEKRQADENRRIARHRFVEEQCLDDCLDAHHRRKQACHHA